MSMSERGYNKEKIVNDVLAAILNEGYDKFTFALRKDNELYNPGDTPNKSLHWYDYDFENAVQLDGTCATNIDLLYCSDDTDEEIEEMRSIISELVEFNFKYSGNNFYLLKCEKFDYTDGEDEFEIIMNNPVVVSKIELYKA